VEVSFPREISGALLVDLYDFHDKMPYYADRLRFLQLIDRAHKAGISLGESQVEVARDERDGAQIIADAGMNDMGK
jgi:hypothetical protein